MAKHKVEITGINTNDIKVLTSEEMEKLFQELKQGNKKAREDRSKWKPKTSIINSKKIQQKRWKHGRSIPNRVCRAPKSYRQLRFIIWSKILNIPAFPWY